VISLPILTVPAALVAVVASIFSRHRKGGETPRREREKEREREKGEASRQQPLVFDDLSSERQRPQGAIEIPPRRPLSTPPLKVTAKPSAPPPAQTEFEVTNFFDHEAEALSAETDPRVEFDYLLGKVLAVVKEVLFAHSAVYAWANFEKRRMVIETKSTVASNFTSQRRFPMESDLMSQIAAGGKPQVVSCIEPANEKDLIPYYGSLAFVKSFVGVPVFFGQRVVGVLAADSKAEDAFGVETLSLLSLFTRLLSALIKSYTEKYDLQLESRGFAVLARMQDRLVGPVTPVGVAELLIDEALALVDAERAGVIMFDEDRRKWRVVRAKRRGAQTDSVENCDVALDSSIAGEAIRENVSKLVTDFAAAGKVRYSRGEPAMKDGSILVVPMTSLQHGFGALTLETGTRQGLNERDEKLLRQLAGEAANVLEIISLTKIVRDFVAIDDLTGLLNGDAFATRLKEELLRSRDLKTNFAVVVAAVDKREELLERHGTDGFDRILLNVSEILRSVVRPYDVVGRFETNRFGVGLSGMSANDAYLWAEKLRKYIASHVITLDEKNLSVTVSAGVCGAVPAAGAEELVTNASQVLEKAMEAGGNGIRVF